MVQYFFSIRGALRILFLSSSQAQATFEFNEVFLNQKKKSTEKIQAGLALCCQIVQFVT